MIYFNGTDARNWERTIEPLLTLTQKGWTARSTKIEFLCEDFLCFLDKLKITSCDETE